MLSTKLYLYYGLETEGNRETYTPQPVSEVPSWSIDLYIVRRPSDKIGVRVRIVLSFKISEYNVLWTSSDEWFILRLKFFMFVLGVRGYKDNINEP